MPFAYAHDARISQILQRGNVPLGSATVLALADARRLAAKWRAVVAEGKDPQRERTREAADAAAVHPTLDAVIAEMACPHREVFVHDRRSVHRDDRLRGRRPFAPHAVHATGATGGDNAVTWTRRTRIEVDPRPEGSGVVPLGETAERYSVEVGPAAVPVRALEFTTLAWIYTAANQSADGITAPFEIRVAQISETYRPGPSGAFTVSE